MTPLTTLLRPRRWRGVALALLSAVALTACGAPSPQALFVRDCGVCHSIAGRARQSQQGGDLRGLSLSRRQISQFVAEMPRLHGPLDAAQVRVLTRYVYAAEGH